MFYLNIWRAKDSDYWIKYYPLNQIRQIAFGFKIKLKKKDWYFSLLNWVRGIGIIRFLNIEIR
jgi:hypothetical protein